MDNANYASATTKTATAGIVVLQLKTEQIVKVQQTVARWKIATADKLKATQERTVIVLRQNVLQYARKAHRRLPTVPLWNATEDNHKTLNAVHHNVHQEQRSHNRIMTHAKTIRYSGLHRSATNRVSHKDKTALLFRCTKQAHEALRLRRVVKALLE